MRASVTGFLSLLLLTAGCKDKPPAPKQAPKQAPEQAAKTPRSSSAKAKPSRSPGPCTRTLCIGGPGELSDPANRDLGELCQRAPGIVRDCEGQDCHSVWAVEQWREGLEALITELDQNGDGKVDDRDQACRINAVGWSTGGVIAAEDLPAALREDKRVSGSRAVIEHLVTIVPWAPEREQIKVATNVGKAWIYRHTKTPKGDCSKQFAGGPWLSPTPVCGPKTTCWDYDYSFEPALAFLSRRGARSGLEIGHCNIVALIDKIGLDNIARGVEAPSEHLPYYSNGKHGGRIVHHGPKQLDPIGD